MKKPSTKARTAPAARPAGEEPVAFLARPGAPRIAYRRLPAGGAARGRPGIVFLGGFASDMGGTKATALGAYCRERGRALLRFDYAGHGRSEGDFRDGTIGGWAGDALAALDALTEGPQILVGSSMGGWIMLLVALARPERVAGLVGVAAAPDFTEDLMWARMTAEQRAQLQAAGSIQQPSRYDEGPREITRRLIEEGRTHLLLRGPLPITAPAHLLHGMRDPDVPWQVSLRLAQRLESPDVAVTFIKDGDHRLSRPQDLARLFAAIEGLSGRG